MIIVWPVITYDFPRLTQSSTTSSFPRGYSCAYALSPRVPKCTLIPAVYICTYIPLILICVIFRQFISTSTVYFATTSRLPASSSSLSSSFHNHACLHQLCACFFPNVFVYFAGCSHRRSPWSLPLLLKSKMHLRTSLEKKNL